MLSIGFHQAMLFLRTLLVAYSVLLFVTMTVTQAQYSPNTCIKDPRFILLAEAATKDKSVNRYYYICSNTIMNIKPYNWVTQTYTNSSSTFVRPLIFIYPNAHIICGPDGNPSNNCIMRGGTFQLEVSDATYFSLSTQKITNVSVEGVTFTNLVGTQQSASANIYIFGTPLGADLLVKNCIFQNNFVIANIKFEDNYLSSVTVENSVFSKNTIVPTTSQNSGLIFSDLGGSITITNTLFTDNAVNTSYPHDWYRLNAVVNSIDISGWSNITSKVSVQNSCFIRNTGISYALVLGGMYGDGTLSQTGNVATGNTFLQTGSMACSGIGALYMDPDYYYGGYYNFTLGKCLQTFLSSSCKLSTSTTTLVTSSSSPFYMERYASMGIKIGVVSLFLIMM